MAAAGVAVDPLSLCWSGAHPVSRDMIAINSPTTTVIEGSGVINVDLVRASSCVMWSRQRNIVADRANHVPSSVGVTYQSIYRNW